MDLNQNPWTIKFAASSFSSFPHPAVSVSFHLFGCERNSLLFFPSSKYLAPLVCKLGLRSDAIGYHAQNMLFVHDTLGVTIQLGFKELFQSC